ncbi:helix-turn-helix transcriptional regulator [Halorussus aquaticus]|uniref:Helix-turn-helix transcriptional regulator n=1 Tax=Halorussus aquaticus TaxID=2953748 RepID=A0ABD5PZ74_9EURY|nr:hypothetical protein [Halorussus aquaticus]
MDNTELTNLVEREVGDELRDVLHKRSDILDAVADRPRTKPELIDIVDKSRSTIDRGVDDLESVDCIERRNGAYHPTTKGRLALAEYADFTEITNRLETAGEILNHLSSENPISRVFLEDVTIHSANPHVPGAALEERNELLRSSTRMIGLTPTALCSFPDTLAEVVRDQSITIEIVVEEAVFESLSEVKSDRITALVAHDDVTFYTFEGTLPYALWVMEQEDDTYAGITVYENGGVQGVLINDTTEAVAWAERVYQKYRTRAN